MTALPAPTDGPCRECPWRKVAAPGWLGPHTAAEWVALAHGEAPIACHLTIRPGPRSADWSQPGVRQCAGAASYRANIAKLPRDPEVALGPRSPDIFGGPPSFLAHHGGSDFATSSDGRKSEPLGPAPS